MFSLGWMEISIILIITIVIVGPKEIPTVIKFIKKLKSFFVMLKSVLSKIKSRVLILFILSACSSIPKNTQNSCAIFEERYLWYKHAKASYERWGAPIHLQLAFVKKESDFNWLAKPPRKKLFKVIPFKRPSSSFGYSQAVKGTWEQYKRETNSPLATRARFKDSVDFIGWYIHKTNKILKISKKDPYKQYLAYYKGWGDYKNYSKDKKAIIYAKSVKDMANKYRKQLTLCKKNLDKNKYIIF